MEYAKSLIKDRGPRSITKASTGEGESSEEEVEEWTLVENDSDPEATSSPTAMMQHDQQQQSPFGNKKKASLISLSLRGR